MMKRLVVGYDGSEPSRHALRWALKHGADIVIAHAIGLDGEPAGDEERRLGDDRLAQAVLEARSFIGGATPDRRVDSVLLEGPVGWALTELASGHDALVVGTHKTGFLRGRVLGSRSVEVAMLATCDVVVVPGMELRFRRGVVAGVSDAADMPVVVEAAAENAAALGDELLLVHGRGQRPTRTSDLLGEARRVAHAVAPTTVVRTRASDRPLAELLLDAGRDRALIVLGEQRDRSRSPLGTVVHDVLLNLTAPTLVVHAGDRAAAD